MLSMHNNDVQCAQGSSEMHQQVASCAALSCQAYLATVDHSDCPAADI